MYFCNGDHPTITIELGAGHSQEFTSGYADRITFAISVCCSSKVVTVHCSVAKAARGVTKLAKANSEIAANFFMLG